MHAVDRWQDHERTWGPGSELVRRLNSGGGAGTGTGWRLQLVLQAMFPGWRHFVKSGELRVVWRLRQEAGAAAVAEAEAEGGPGPDAGPAS